MKYLFLFLTILSCSSEKAEKKAQIQFWEILETYDSSWIDETILQKLGKPNGQLQDQQGTTWIYKTKSSWRGQEYEMQDWAIGVTEDHKISSITYIPVSQENPLYIFDVEKRWLAHHCTHKKETKLVVDNYKTKRWMECDKGKRVIRYNRFNEVSSIHVSP